MLPSRSKRVCAAVCVCVRVRACVRARARALRRTRMNVCMGLTSTTLLPTATDPLFLHSHGRLHHGPRPPRPIPPLDGAIHRCPSPYSIGVSISSSHRRPWRLAPCPGKPLRRHASGPKSRRHAPQPRPHPTAPSTSSLPSPTHPRRPTPRVNKFCPDSVEPHHARRHHTGHNVRDILGAI